MQEGFDFSEPDDSEGEEETLPVKYDEKTIELIREIFPLFFKDTPIAESKTEKKTLKKTIRAFFSSMNATMPTFQTRIKPKVLQFFEF